jgi:cytochrome c oxidase accessory protein FixG
MSEPEKTRLPLLPATAPQSSLRADGSRAFVYPADVSGRFVRARRLVFFALVALWAALPWIPIGGHPAIFLDIEHRNFFLFGATFNAQDIWLFFFVLTGTAFSLLYVTAVAGRVFCGWACPQTVFLEGIYRPIERLTEGPREKRIKLAKAPWGIEKILRRSAKHLLFLATSVLVAHVFVAYFVSLPRLYAMVRSNPGAHPEAFGWAMGVTALFYGNFAWAREQVCLIICPYGRLQSVLTDPDSITIGYDEKRGEPRGKAGSEGAGDCVDCKRCVVVCPTAIDIREGMQLDCVGCTQCIDACDEIMDKLGRPRGLVRYDSLNGLAGKPRRFLRPRLLFYTAMMLLGAAVATFAFRKHVDFEANLLRQPGLPYVMEGGTVRNSFTIHVVNKRSGPEAFTIEPEPMPGVTFVVPLGRVELASFASATAPVFVSIDGREPRADFPITVRIRRVGADDPKSTITVKAPFLGPSAAVGH